MFSTIFQLSNRPIEKREYIGIEHVGQGDMVFMDYTCEIDNEDRKREIKNLAGRILPEGMFTLNADETLAYNGGFTEWRKTYLDLIRKRTDALTEKNIMEGAGTAYHLQKAILNPLATDCLFITEFCDGHGTAERSRELMRLVETLAAGEKLYIGAVIGYRF